MEKRRNIGRTDLAIEVKESFPEDSVEIQGVRLEKQKKDTLGIEITTVEILNPQGAAQMGKPEGCYVTLEFQDLSDGEKNIGKSVEKCLCTILKTMVQRHIKTSEKKCYFVAGLGNRFATPDALGPFVVENMVVNRHMDRVQQTTKTLCGIAPGVMAQTGIESGEIMKGIIQQIQPDLLLVIDALATCSIKRLCHTIQITDTGIAPGSGIGNHRLQINENTMGIPVIAIGVPTVVEAHTIVLENMEAFLKKQSLSQKETELFLDTIAKEPINNLFVTPKDVEMQIKKTGEIIAGAIQRFVSE